MIVAILVIGYVLVLRYFDKKNRERDRERMGLNSASGPADYTALQKQVAMLAEKLESIESSYQILQQRLGGLR